MLISIGYMCLMLCAPLDWQYAELPSSASDAVLCIQILMFTRKSIIFWPNLDLGPIFIT